MEDEFKKGDKVVFAYKEKRDGKTFYYQIPLLDPKSGRKYGSGVFVRYHYDRRFALVDCARARATKDGDVKIDQFPVPVAQLRRPGWQTPSVPAGGK